MRKLTRWFKGGGARPDQSALPVDPLSDAFIQDPYLIYDQLRREHPVVPMEGGGFLLTRHADVVKAMKGDAFGNTPSRFSRLHPKNRSKYISTDLAAHIPPFLDAPVNKGPENDGIH